MSQILECLAIPDIEMKNSAVTDAAVVAITAFSFNSQTLSRGKRAIISTIGGAIRLSTVTANPTNTTLGHPLADGQTWVVHGTANINNLKFIAKSGDSPTVTVTIGY